MIVDPDVPKTLVQNFQLLLRLFLYIGNFGFVKDYAVATEHVETLRLSGHHKLVNSVFLPAILPILVTKGNLFDWESKFVGVFNSI